MEMTRCLMMRKRLLTMALAALLLFSLTACGGEDVMERVDSISVSEMLLLSEDRVEATPEDLVDSRYYGVTTGVTANQFILLEGTDAEAAERLEQALRTYAEDQKSGFDLYFPEQAARFEDPILVREGKYVLFAIGEDKEPLADLCGRLMRGEDGN